MGSPPTVLTRQATTQDCSFYDSELGEWVVVPGPCIIPAGYLCRVPADDILHPNKPPQ